VISPNQHVILVASVPLIEEAWEPFHEGEVIAISDGELKARVPAPKPALVAE
jgi:predicted glutamine amidotransferase